MRAPSRGLPERGVPSQADIQGDDRAHPVVSESHDQLPQMSIACQASATGITRLLEADGPCLNGYAFALTSLSELISELVEDSCDRAS